MPNQNFAYGADGNREHHSSGQEEGWSQEHFPALLEVEIGVECPKRILHLICLQLIELVAQVTDDYDGDDDCAAKEDRTQDRHDFQARAFRR